MKIAITDDIKVLKSYNHTLVNFHLDDNFEKDGSIHFIRSFDTPANDKRKNDNNLW